MVKIHTRTKRKMGDIKGRLRAKRPKTFKSEASANSYAEQKGMKDFKLVNISINPLKPKIKIVA